MPQKLGQHFLKNKAKLKKIADALELTEGDIVIEVGPGHGELTKELRSKNSELRIIAIEKDIDLASSLKLLAFRNKWQDIEVVRGDALREIKNQISRLRQGFGGQAKISAIGGSAPGGKITNQKSKIIENLKVVGNIPYYITGHLLRILGELEYKPKIIVFTIQKEVAERITAKPPRMNLLAASVQFWAEPKIIGSISKKDFKPVPKVDSIIIRLTPYEISNFQFPISNYYRFIRILFKQPRKTIVNNLCEVRSMNNELGMSKQKIIEKLERLGIRPSDRPQNLTLEQIIKLAQVLYPSFTLHNS